MSAPVYDPKTMIRVSETRSRINRKLPDGDNHHVRLVDVSGPDSYGYAFEVREERATVWDKWQYMWLGWETVRVIAESITVFLPDTINKIGNKGAYTEAFWLKDLVSESL